MAIKAYIIENGKYLRTETLQNNDPSEQELIDILGGIPSDMAAITLGSVGRVEVNFVASQPNFRLVIGKAPGNWGDPKVRPDITLPPGVAENLAEAVENLWKKYGSAM
ncbi:hypothetical protein AB4Z52_13605 [Rhizobium sp. 2YAF20]|uniref:hypothetical protein n=1 Tax=Rhizobium sp. 2YAF20 TaxID=3233027 RepID=UPI003F9AE65E